MTLPARSQSREPSRGEALALIARLRNYAVATLDPDGRVTSWNEAACLMKGYAADEIVGQSFARFYAPEDVAALRPQKLLRAALEQGHAEDESWRVRKDGSRFWASVDITPIQGDDGRLLAFGMITRDLTGRKAAESAALREREERLRLMIDSVKDYAIFMLDPNGNVLTWNAGARQIKGYDAHEIVGQSMSRFYAEEDVRQGKPRALLALADRDGRVEDEGWRMRKDGSRFWADVVISRVASPEGRLLGFVKVTRDLTERKAAENALREREEILSATLYSIGDGVIATDETSCITRINPVAAALTGWTESEGRGRPIDEVFRIVNEDTRKPAENPVHRVLSEGIVVGLANHTALIARDGSELPIADSGAPITNGAGVTRGVVLVFRDVTTKRAMEVALADREEPLRLMIDSVRDYAIFMLDIDGRITSWNSGAERIKGYAEQDILGKHFSVFYTEEDRARGTPERELEAAAKHGRVEDEGWRVRKDGSQFLGHVVISAVHDDKGKLRGFAKLTRDVTERRQMEQEVQEQRSRAMAAQLALKERDEFITIAAHELRTPLTALQLKLESLGRALERGGTVASGPGSASNRLEGAIKQTWRLAELVERLLDVSRIVAGKLEMTIDEVELGGLVRQVVEDFQEVAHENGSEIRFTAKQPVNGAWDRLRVQQVVANLLSNAVKFGGRNSIEVQVDDNGTQGRIVVSDQGIGIAAENIERIFDRFQRGVPEQHIGGLGLGLYIARYIAVAHGGSVKAESAAGHGSTFVVELPKRGPLGGGTVRDTKVTGE